MQRSLAGIFARSAVARSHLALTRPVQQISQHKFHRTEQVLAWEEFGHIVTELKPILEVVGLVGAGFWGGYTAYNKQVSQTFFSFCSHFSFVSFRLRKRRKKFERKK